jgi:hypothetical protein
MGEPATRLNNMKLWIWNKLGINFSSSQLQENFERLDSHKHGPEEGQQIESSGIADGAVTAPKLGAEAVGPSNIRAYSVGRAALAGESVTREKIAQEAVTGTKVAFRTLGETNLSVEALEAAGLKDVLQAGIVKGTDWSFVATIDSATGALGSEAATGGVAWIERAPGLLVRTVTANIVLSGIVPSALPQASGFLSCAIELAPVEGEWNNAVVVSAHSGQEYATQAEARAHPPATTAGKLQVRRFVIENAAGVYSLHFQEDVRPWAVGNLEPQLKGLSGTINAISGEFIEIGALSVVNLPTPIANAVVSIFATTGTATIKATGGAEIFGDFIYAATEITLSEWQHVLLKADGTNWLILAGEPKRTQAYSAQVERVNRTEYEVSSTREADVVVEGRAFENAGTAVVVISVSINGVTLGRASGIAPETGGEAVASLSFRLPAGSKWSASLTGHGTSSIHECHRLL